MKAFLTLQDGYTGMMIIEEATRDFYLPRHTSEFRFSAPGENAPPIDQIRQFRLQCCRDCESPSGKVERVAEYLEVDII